jgi:hypothetical protein
MGNLYVKLYSKIIRKLSGTFSTGCTWCNDDRIPAVLGGCLLPPALRPPPSSRHVEPTARQNFNVVSRNNEN